MITHFYVKDIRQGNKLYT